jgi:subtilisin-like proprotein convertase family protein
LRAHRFIAGSLVGAVLVAACGPDWDALDPSLGETGNQKLCPPDGNDCTHDECDGLIPKYVPVDQGLPCNQNGGSVCNASGVCVECNVAADCPGEDSACQSRTCTMLGTCGVENQPMGQAVATQTPGDCLKVVCDGVGGVKNDIDDLDTPDDGQQCTADQCSSGQPMHPPLIINTSCTQDDGELCNGAGACVECNAPTDCGMDAPCVKFSCDAGKCPVNPVVPPGESCGVNARCDDMGGCIACQASNALLFTSSDPPLSVPESNAMGVTSTVLVSGLGASIVDVNVTVTLTGDASGDLTLTLVSPKGTMIDLSSNNGGANDNNFAGTMFDDDSTSARITKATFTNNVTVVSAIPERNLGLLNGEDPNGTWLLTVKDTGSLGSLGGLLTSWSLAVTAQGGNNLFPPVSFPNNNAVATADGGEVSSSVTVSDVPGFVYKATVNTNLPHKSAAQLVVTLVSPANKAIVLTSKNGAANNTADVLAGTTFDDAAPSLIACPPAGGAGCVTFMNNVAVQSAIPEGSLSALVGDDPNGTWTLKVFDTANGQSGSLDAWSLTLTPALCPITP